MNKKVIILDDKVVMYMRFSTEEQVKKFESKYLILHKSKAKVLCETLLQKLFNETKIPNLLNRRVDNNGIF